MACDTTVAAGALPGPAASVPVALMITGGPATTGPAAEQVLYTLKVDGAAHSVARAPSSVSAATSRTRPSR